MTTHEQTIDLYLAAYGEPDAATRRRHIMKCFAADAVLADPPAAATGHDELDALFAAVQGQFPGHRFERTTAIDEHHDAARYGWALVAPDGSTTLVGFDFVQFGSDGLLRTVTGFFGEQAPK
jgi:hypothetical protein